MKLVAQFLILTIILTAFSSIVVAWVMVTSLMQPEQKSCSSDGYIYCDSPAELGLKYRNVQLITEDNVRLKGWYVKSESKKHGIVIAHEHGGTRYSGLRYLKALYEKGFNVLLLDLRNSGDSEGQFSSSGYYERKDVLIACRYLLSKQNLKSVGVLGFAEGASAAIFAMNEEPAIKVGVFEAPYFDFKEIADARTKNFVGPLSMLLNPLVHKFHAIRAQWGTGELTPGQAIATLDSQAVFIIHGENDRAIPISQGVKLYQVANHPKRIWAVRNGGHLNAYNHKAERVTREIVSFFSKHL